MREAIMLRLFMFILIFPVIISAQELNATVLVNMDQIDAGTRTKLENFKNNIEDYLNKNKFTSSPWQGEKIQCTFSIYFTSNKEGNAYTTQLIVTSLRPVESTQKNSPVTYIFDNNWSFTYEKNQALIFNQATFSSLTSTLDFYAYVILGFDADSFQKLGGNDCFKKAYDIAIKGATSPLGDANWESSNSPYYRRGLLENLLDDRYNQFRIDYFNYHYNGLDLLYSDKTHDIGFKNILKMVTDISETRDKLDSRSVLLKVFFDAKYIEICEALRNYPDKSIFSILKRIDPNHVAKYVELQEAK